MSENKSVDVLKQALLLEKRGHAFYQTAAEQSKDPVVKEFFQMMAEEENAHVETLSTQFRFLMAGKKFVDFKFPQSKVSHAATKVLNKETQTRIASADFEAAAISAAILMEERAIQFYSERAQNTNDPEEKKLYNWLSEWEATHLRFLSEIDKKLTESIWNDNNFWPF
jgi:rubrerythrin